MDPRYRYLSAPLAMTGDELPREVLAFRKGVNETAKGRYLFDARSAELILEQLAREGVDYMTDLEHYSISKDARMHRQDAQDARGWFNVRVDPDGSLVLCNMTWTPDGEDRLRTKKQRYISPVFETENAGDGLERVTGIVNAALCARPATYHAQPLVAASRTTALSCASRASCYVALARLEKLSGKVKAK